MLCRILVRRLKSFILKIQGDEKLLMMEFLLHGLAEYSLLSKNTLPSGMQFKDLFGSVFSNKNLTEEE